MRIASVCFGLFINLFASCFVTPALAGSFSSETEVGGAKKSATFASQYIFYNAENFNALARYFYVDKA